MKQLYRRILGSCPLKALAFFFFWAGCLFADQPQIAVLTAPADGATNVDPDCVFQWTSVSGAQAYYLWVGTSAGASDVINTGSLPNTSNSWPGIDLPLGRMLYVKIWTQLDGRWWPSDSTFATSAAVPTSSTTPNGASSMVFPANGAMNIDAGQPFQWTYSDNAGVYWLLIGTTHGGYDVSNSGPIHVPRQFITSLPIGTALYGQLFVKAGGIWSLADDFTFSARSNTTTTNVCIQSAFWATDYVRNMADDSNKTSAGTLLDTYAFPRIYYPYASCGTYAETLMTILHEMALPLDVSILRVVFNPNVVDCDGHVLVEMFNSDQQSWMLLDPTFDLTARRSSDGAWATAEDINSATLNQTWNQIEYVFLGAKSDTYASHYYIDYPLLYLNIYHAGTPIVPDQGPSVLPFYSRMPLPHVGYGVYAIRSTTQSTVDFVDSANWNKLYSVDCDGVDSFSTLFYAWSVAVPDGESSFELYRPNRYVFGTSMFVTPSQVATLTTFADGATRVPSSVTIEWTSVPDAQAYRLEIGTSPGAGDIVNSGVIHSLSYAISGLPYAQTLYATIWTELAGVWWPSQSSFTTAPQIAVLTSPANGATKVASSCTFEWTGVASAQAYYLWVGTSPGAKDVVNSRGLPASSTSYTVKNLPYGQTLYATIWTELAGHWWSSGSTFTTAPQIAVLTSPADGATKVTSSCTFQWTGVAAAQAYYLWLGTSPWTQDIVNTGSLSASNTSYAVTGLPFGQTLYAIIWTKLAGVWWPSQSSFTTMAQIAVLTSPADGETGVTSSCTFQWTSVAAAQAYYLWVGTSPGAKDVVNSRGLPASSTSYTAKSLPYGQTLYATIWTELAGHWCLNSSTFTTAPQVAVLTSPANGATKVASSCTFQWTGMAAAQGYCLWVGTSPWTSDVINTDSLSASNTSYNATGLPFGQTLYAIIWTELDGDWWPSQSSFTTMAPIAVLTSPADGETGVASSCTFQWTGVAAAQAYYLWVGTSPGAKDVVNSRGLPASSTSYTAKSLPYGQTLYATIWTELAGHWCPNSSTFTTAPQSAVLTSPADGATKVASSCTFQWAGVAAAQGYCLWVGTSPWTSDVINTGSLSASNTSYTATGLPFGQTLYAIIWTELDGDWWPSQSSFTTSLQIATLITPADGATGVTSPCVFQWNSVAGAQCYHLWVGTSPNAHDVVYIGGDTLISYSARNLPYAQTLYATLWTEVGGAWYSSSSTFTTAPQVAALTALINGAVQVDPDYVLKWAGGSGAEAYYLPLGGHDSRKGRCLEQWPDLCVEYEHAMGMVFGANEVRRIFPAVPI